MTHNNNIIKQLNCATSVREANKLYKTACVKCMDEDMNKSCQHCLIRLTRNIVIEKKFDDERE